VQLALLARLVLHETQALYASSVTDPLAPFRVRPEASGVFLDFDGTLSEIVPVPSEARPAAGVPELLARLAEALAVVAVVSGRSAEQLLAWLGPSVEIWGVHGAQRSDGGRVALSARAEPYRSLMREVLREAREELAIEGVTVEDKAVVVTLHYRSAGEAARRAVVATAERLADRHGLTVHEGRKSFELRPPVELSKATVVLDRAREANLEAAMFVGDDTVDLPAFGALDELAAGGVATLRVAVRSDEAPEDLLRRADVVVEGPPGVVTYLEQLAPSPHRAR
jgi:trehalose 6-phosphate phosphatase